MQEDCFNGLCLYCGRQLSRERLNERISISFCNFCSFCENQMFTVFNNTKYVCRYCYSPLLVGKRDEKFFKICSNPSCPNRRIEEK